MDLRGIGQWLGEAAGEIGFKEKGERRRRWGAGERDNGSAREVVEAAGVGVGVQGYGEW